MFRFENNIFFYAFAILPVMLIVFVWYLYSTKKQLKKLGEYALIKSLVPDVSRAKKITKFVLLMFAFSSLILALCNLQTGSKTQEVKREGADIIVCLDVSNSMLAQDLSPVSYTHLLICSTEYFVFWFLRKNRRVFRHPHLK